MAETFVASDDTFLHESGQFSGKGGYRGYPVSDVSTATINVSDKWMSERDDWIYVRWFDAGTLRR